MQLYTKGKDGEFTEATHDQLTMVFKDRLERFKRTELDSLKSEAETAVREELTPKLTEELTEKIQKQIEADYKPKLEKAEESARKLDIKVRQKTIASEYGFSPDLENFLGDGTDEEMKAKADVLKKNYSAGVKPPEKVTTKTVQSGFVTKVD